MKSGKDWWLVMALALLVVACFNGSTTLKADIAFYFCVVCFYLSWIVELLQPRPE